MSDQVITAVVTVLTALVGLAVIATLVSRNANTTGILSAGSSGFARSISAATAPVTGGAFGALSGLSFSGGAA